MATRAFEHALFRRQRAHLARMIEAPSPYFRQYEARYRSQTRSYEAVISRANVAEAVRASEIVYVGDYHTLRSAQETYLSLVEDARSDGRRVVLALEFVEGRFQSELNRYLSRALPEELFLQRLGLRGDPVSIWNGFRPVLAYARTHGLEVVAIDSRARGTRSLVLRDRYAAERIAKVAKAKDAPRVLVLMGQYHVAPSHLPAAVEEALRGTQRRSVIVYQNCESLFWRIPEGTPAVRVRDGELCLFNASPALCQQSFFDHVELDPADALLPPSALPEAFRQVARLIGRQLEVDVSPALDGVRVVSLSDPDPVGLLSERAQFTPAELSALRARWLSRQSTYVPRARLAYLASLSLAQSAQEAAQFVRHLCVGGGVERTRTGEDAFYGRVLEAALGFLGSRLVHPERPCTSVAAWRARYTTGRGREKRIAGQVLAHLAALDNRPRRVRRGAGEPLSGAGIPTLRIPRSSAMFDGLSQALGSLLGDALDQAFRTGRLERGALRALFCDPFEDPKPAFHALWRTLQSRPRRPSEGGSLPLGRVG